MPRPKLRLALALLLFIAACALAAPHALRQWLWWSEQNPLLRGRVLAVEQGCVACHDPYRGTEIPNPGSRWGTVPRFEAGNAMMYAESVEEIEQFIRHGVPDAWRFDFEASARMAEQRIRMPAYEGRVSAADIADLTAWSSAVEGLVTPGDETAHAGRQLAREQGCLACHGLEGSGGLPNPDSIGGFIPGFLGGNFDHLVESRAEFDEWVKTGRLARLENSFTRRAWDSQTIPMPAYGEALSEEQLDQLWAWVMAVREEYSR